MESSWSRPHKGSGRRFSESKPCRAPGRVAGAGGRTLEVLPGEGALMGRLAGGRSLDQWVEVWEKIAHLFARAAAVNLDRKQVVLSVLLTLQSAARA